MAIPSSRSFFGVDRFHLEIDGISTGSFVRCGGLAASVGVFEYAEGGYDGVRKFRGASGFSNLVLERGLLLDRELFDWYTSGARRDGAVVLIAASGRETHRWVFSRGWPCRWEGPELDAHRTEVALELLEIAHEGLQCVVR